MVKNKIFTKTLQTFFIVTFLSCSLNGYGQIERFVAGTHYQELANPVNTKDSAKVEVIEAFWYGCSHCFRFEPLIVNWEENAPDYVDFQRFPALWNG